MCSKISLLALPRGEVTCSGGALTTFPHKLRPQFFLRPGDAPAPSTPPGYAYGHEGRKAQNLCEKALHRQWLPESIR